MRRYKYGWVPRNPGVKDGPLPNGDVKPNDLVSNGHVHMNNYTQMWAETHRRVCSVRGQPPASWEGRGRISSKHPSLLSPTTPRLNIDPTGGRRGRTGRCIKCTQIHRKKKKRLLQSNRKLLFINECSDSSYRAELISMLRVLLGISVNYCQPLCVCVLM